jgi:hypothetical protein
MRTMNPDDIVTDVDQHMMQLRHQPANLRHGATTVCGECSQAWPCDASRLLAHIHQVRLALRQQGKHRESSV